MVSENKALIFNLKKKKSKKHYFHDLKGLKFCDQILQALAILDKNLKFFSFSSVLILLFSNAFFSLIFHSGVAL